MNKEDFSDYESESMLNFCEVYGQSTFVVKENVIEWIVEDETRILNYKFDEFGNVLLSEDDIKDTENSTYIGGMLVFANNRLYFNSDSLVVSFIKK